MTTSTLHVPLLESSRQRSSPFVNTEPPLVAEPKGFRSFHFGSCLFGDARSLAKAKFLGCSQAAVSYGRNV
jgi:hypothetical protein